MPPLADYSAGGRPAPPPQSIPDVPIVPGMPEFEQMKPPSPAKGNPMRLEDFEAGLKEVMAQPPGQQPGSGQVELVEVDDSDELEELAPPGGAGAFDVVVSNCTGPQAVQLIAELMRLPVEQARKRSRWPKLTVAKNLPEAEARKIADRFRAAGAQAAVQRK